MGKLSRNKGADFERLVAKMFRDSLEAEKDEIMRTPLSGGHSMGDRGDLQVSARIRSRFPFCVECKHSKEWRPGHFMTKTPGYMEKSWLEQAAAAAARAVPNQFPLLVIRGNRTPIYAVFPVAAEESIPLPFVSPYLVFTAETSPWKYWQMILFEDFLSSLAGIPYKKKEGGPHESP